MLIADLLGLALIALVAIGPAGGVVIAFSGQSVEKSTWLIVGALMVLCTGLTLATPDLVSRQFYGVAVALISVLTAFALAVGGWIAERRRG